MNNKLKTNPQIPQIGAAARKGALDQEPCRSYTRGCANGWGGCGGDDWGLCDYGDPRGLMWSLGLGLSGNILPERERKPNSASESDWDSASDSDSDSDSELQAFSHQEKLHTGTSIMGNPDSDSESDSASDADSDSDSELQTFSHQEKLHTGQLPSIMGKSGTESRNNKLYDWGLCDYGGPRGLMWSLGFGLSGNILPERERKPLYALKHIALKSTNGWPGCC